ncbi:MAG: class I adenylate cyclase [Thermodesulfobacteriota bacterium]|nr:class I adenylate cyclase [Thermodesulfobacteriota bacterium]
MISINTRIKGFQRYNKGRKIKAIHFHPDKAAFFFKVIPYLLHSNYSDLPGFIDQPGCPYGIHQFLPETFPDISIFNLYFPESTALSVRKGSSTSPNPCIHSLKIIGSIGTIAQTEKSDCDYWVSIRRKELGEDGLNLLEKKCRLIEKWAAEYDHEIYFFLMDIDQTRENSFSSDAEEESAGSALKLLLKDELFRTHILVSGKMPLWWLIPPGLTSKQYSDYVSQLISTKQINPDNYIDLGYLSEIPREEIFGACLWQMNKALDSPFKSVIKFAYLELLLDQKSNDVPLLSNKIKQLVTFPEQLTNAREMIKLEEIDPYLLLAREIVTFYRNDKTLRKEEKFIRQCLYLKAVSGMKSRETIHLSGSMALMKQWELLPDQHEKLTGFHAWSFKRQIKTGARIHDYLIETYKRLRLILKTFQNETGVTITERDISILGRKLYTFYDKKNHKINYLRTISRDVMVREHLTFHITKTGDEIFFYVFEGEHDIESLKANKNLLIKKDTCLLELLAWLLVNGIIDKKTTFHLTPTYLPIVLADIQSLADILLRTFPKLNFARISAEDLLEEEQIVQALVVINFDKKPVKNSSTLQSAIISVNSYGEYFIHHYDTLAQLKNRMSVLLTRHLVSRWNNNLEIYIPSQPEQYHIKTMINLN